MTNLAGLMLGALLAMLLAPQSPTARLLHWWLVELPVAIIARWQRRHMIYALLLVGLVMFGGEIILMLGPEFAFAYAAEMATYLDIMVVTVVAARMVNIRAGLNHGARRVAQISRTWGRRARRASRHARRAKPPANDDEHRPECRAA